MKGVIGTVRRALPYVRNRLRSKGAADVASLVMRRYGFETGSVALANLVRHRFADDIVSPRLKAIQIETLAYCNYSCSFCPTNQINMPKGRMDDRIFHKIVDDLKNFDGEVRLYLRNEPLLDKRIVKYSKMIKENSFATVVIQTNGSLLTEGIAESLSKYARILVNDYSGGEVSERISSFADKYDIISVDRSSADGLTNRAGNLPGSPVRELAAFCVRPFEQMYIAYDGRAALCCQDWILEEILGDFSTQSLSEIWSGDAYINKRRELYAKKREGLCKKCDFPGI